ncbi:hypothetical protein F5888DRAFT_1723425 [Russula emetica]|nr:hypothetical protein F5888DRAFT_1723425 [Russula emetica]
MIESHYHKDEKSLGLGIAVLRSRSLSAIKAIAFLIVEVPNHKYDGATGIFGHTGTLILVSLFTDVRATRSSHSVYDGLRF